jgi:hypothetical protein
MKNNSLKFPLNNSSSSSSPSLSSTSIQDLTVNYKNFLNDLESSDTSTDPMPKSGEMTTYQYQHQHDMNLPIRRFICNGCTDEMKIVKIKIKKNDSNQRPYKRNISQTNSQRTTEFVYLKHCGDVSKNSTALSHPFHNDENNRIEDEIEITNDLTYNTSNDEKKGFFLFCFK